MTDVDTIGPGPKEGLEMRRPIGELFGTDAATELADETGDPREKFSAEEYEYPDFDDLESITDP